MHLNNLIKNRPNMKATEDSLANPQGLEQINYKDICFPSKRNILSDSKKEQQLQNRLDEDMIDDMVFSDKSGSPIPQSRQVTGDFDSFLNFG